MKIHLIGLAHTKTSPKFLTCAYTQKVWKLAHMLVKLGYDVMHYGTEGADVPCKHIDVLSDAMWLFIGERKWRHMEGYLHVGAFLA